MQVVINTKMKIEALIEIIEGRPLMYLRSKNIHYLMAFLYGFSFCEDANNRENNLGDELGQIEGKLDSFTAWVLNKYDAKDRHGLESVLTYKSGNEEEAYELFFTLWHEFNNNL
jgi:hypothetical protein